MNETYIVYKSGLYSSFPIAVTEGNSTDVNKIRLEYERENLAIPGMLYHYAEVKNNWSKLINYLQEDLGINNLKTMQQGDSIRIYPDFSFPREITLESTQEILEIMEHSVYRLIPINDELKNKFILLLYDVFERPEKGNIDDYIFPRKLQAELSVLELFTFLHGGGPRNNNYYSLKSEEFKNKVKALNYFSFNASINEFIASEKLNDLLRNSSNESIARAIEELNTILEICELKGYKIIKL